MPDAQDIHGTVFKNGSATLLARVAGADGAAMTRADVVSIRYTVHLLDDNDPDQQTPLAGHAGVAIPVSSVVYDTLQCGPLWSRDAVGYNFMHVLDVSVQQAFPTAGRSYRVVYELTPAVGQIILVRFRVHAI